MESLEKRMKSTTSNSSLRETGEYVGQQKAQEYSGLKPLGEVVFSGGTSIRYWM